MSKIQHTKLSLLDYDKSFALLSDDDQWNVRRAVVFVHGFNGSARGTWTDFVSLVDNPSISSAWWELADLFFFHYQWDSVFQQLTNNTLRIHKFIEQIFPTPNIIGRAHAYRSEKFEYEELFLVAHSEGGLLMRKVLLEAAQRDKRLDKFIRTSKGSAVPEPSSGGMLKAKLRLFAPALGGDMQSGFLGVVTSLPFISNALSSSAAKKGMNQGSPAVTEARRQTDRYAEHFLYECFRAHILWAAHDSIINSEKYAEDLHCRNLPTGSTHTSICKPNLSYSLPLSFIEEGIDHHECQ
jgi:pimeloyl-ACP methyl ester carboxylesterase